MLLSLKVLHGSDTRPLGKKGNKFERFQKENSKKNFQTVWGCLNWWLEDKVQLRILGSFLMP